MQGWSTNGSECPLIDNWALDGECNIIHLTVGKESRVLAYHPQSLMPAISAFIGRVSLGYRQIRGSFLEILSTVFFCQDLQLALKWHVPGDHSLRFRCSERVFRVMLSRHDSVCA